MEQLIQQILGRIRAIEERFGKTEVIENIQTIVGYVATTNAAITTLATIPVPASTTIVLEAHVSARRTGGAAGAAEDGAGYVIYATYKNVAGTATLIGAVAADYTAESQAGWNATFTVSGGNVLLQVTGAVNNNVSWFGDVQIRAIST